VGRHANLSRPSLFSHPFLSLPLTLPSFPFPTLPPVPLPQPSYLFPPLLKEGPGVSLPGKFRKLQMATCDFQAILNMEINTSTKHVSCTANIVNSCIEIINYPLLLCFQTSFFCQFYACYIHVSKRCNSCIEQQINKSHVLSYFHLNYTQLDFVVDGLKFEQLLCKSVPTDTALRYQCKRNGNNTRLKTAFQVS
jgi:hypothetical protein